MKLNQQQIHFFHTFGYLIVRRAFSPFETAQIVEAFEWSIQNFSGGMEHDGSRRTMFPGPIEHHENLCALMDHPVILGLIGGVTGEEFYYAGGDGNYYCGDTHWHPDGGWGRLLATKTVFYLDSLTSDSGALRVIPGSHHANHIIRRTKINIDNSMIYSVCRQKIFQAALLFRRILAMWSSSIMICTMPLSVAGSVDGCLQ